MSKKKLLFWGLFAVASFVVVSIVAVVAIYFYYAKDLTKQREESLATGRSYAVSTDQNGCMKEGLSRAGKITLFEIGKLLDNANFVEGCLDSSKETPGFCDNVPGRMAAAFDDWEDKQCEKARMDKNETGCKSVFEKQIGYCVQKAKQSK